MKKIASLDIKGLFGRYDYLIDEVDSRDLQILYGKNGCGKTTILKIIYNISELNFSEVLKVDFKHLKVNYDDKSYLEIIKNEEGIVFNIKPDKREIKTINIPPLDKKFIEYIHKPFDRRYREYFYSPTGRHLYRIIEENPIQSIFYTDEVINNEEMVSFLCSKEEMKFLPLLKEFKVSCKFISADRLISVKNDKYHQEEDQSIIWGIENVLKQINNEIIDAAKRYSQLSQEKDSSYVKRLVKTYKDKKEEVVSGKISALKKKIDDLVSLGISTENFNENYSISKVDKGILHALDIYCDDTNEKLSVYKDLEVKLSCFFEIMNLIFSETSKKIKINNNKIEIYDDIRKCAIDVDMLSSGEKHQIILLGDIIFSSSKVDLIIIDEPEISLHIKWQESFINNILGILKENKTNLIIATHSPFIINNYWDDALQLGDIEK